MPSPGDSQSLNRYSYVRNNPLKYTDPSGHALWAGEDIAQEFDLYTANPMGRGWNAHDTEVVAWTAGTLFVGAGAEALVATGAAADFVGAVSWKVAVWASHHPLQAIVGKAVVEESFESAVTGTPFDPRNVLLDVTTQVGDDMLPRRRVYRVWGSDPDDPDLPGSVPWGHSWTPIDPSTVPNYRESAGLPSGGESGAYNTGRFVSVGVINDASGIRVRQALSLDDQPGGLPEFLVPNPQAQITLTGVYGVNPPY